MILDFIFFPLFLYEHTMTPESIAHAIAIGYVIHAVPDMLSKVGWAYDEFKVMGLASAITMLIRSVVGCLRCAMFWTVLGITHSITAAGLTAMAIDIFIQQRNN